jgi:hypothetical protein
MLPLVELLVICRLDYGGWLHYFSVKALSQASGHSSVIECLHVKGLVFNPQHWKKEKPSFSEDFNNIHHAVLYCSVSVHNSKQKRASTTSSPSTLCAYVSAWNTAYARWCLMEGSFAFQGIFCNTWRHFWLSQLKGCVLLAFIESKDDAKCPIVHRTALNNKELLVKIPVMLRLRNPFLSGWVNGLWIPILNEKLVLFQKKQIIKSSLHFVLSVNEMSQTISL